MEFINRRLQAFDRWQQRHTFTAVVCAVIKKNGEDQAGNQSALLTYYGFLAIFPLLLVLTTVLQIVFKHDSHLKTQILTSLNTYFPIIGNQLQGHIHSLRKTGVALAVGILLILYGAKGVADAFRNCVNTLWHVPANERDNYVNSLVKSFGIIGVGGTGLILAAISAGYATSSGHNYGFRLLFTVINLAILFSSFVTIIKLAHAKKVRIRKLWIGAAVASLGILVAQSIGGYVLIHEMKNLSTLYSTFAVVLGLIFWLYIQMEICVYALEVDSVLALKRWPRSLFGTEVAKK
jgi:YihY family inner membrane protein